MIIFDKPLDYSDINIRNEIEILTRKVETNQECFGTENSTESWIRDYIKYIDSNNLTMVYDDKTAFYNVLFNEYLTSDEGKQYYNDIWETLTLGYNASVETPIPSFNNYIEKSRVNVRLKPGTGISTEILVPCLPFFSDIYDEYQDTLGVYIWSNQAPLVFAESDRITIQQTTLNLIYACIAALIITIILIPYPTMAIIVMIAVSQILVGVLGYMSIWNIPINTTTMINVIISVGFAVDNAAHICHSYMNCPIKENMVDNERYYRVLFALNSVGIPIIAGDITTIAALLPIATAQSEIFVSFFRCLLLVMIFGMTHALFYLPVILSFIGPVTSVSNKKIQKHTKNNIELQKENTTFHE